MPLVLLVAAVIGFRLTVSREKTVGFMYKPVNPAIFAHVEVPATGLSGTWYDTRRWLGTGDEGRHTFWAKAHRYHLFFSRTSETVEQWIKRTDETRELFRSGKDVGLPHDNPCILSAAAIQARPRPKVDGIMANLFVRGGVEIEVSGNIGPPELAELVSSIRCGE